MMLNETEIVQRVSEGDEYAFAELFHYYSSRLHVHINAIVKQPDAVDDILQETFVRVWLNRDKLTEIINIRSWIFTIASNVCYNHLRTSIREEQRLQKLARSDVNSESGYDRMDFKEIRLLVAEAVQLLSPQRKKIWYLLRDAGLRQTDVAKKLGISVSTVKNTMTQSLELIRGHLKKKGYTLVIAFFTFLKFFLRA